MFTLKSHYALRTGLFLVATAWFSFNFYEFVNAIVHVIQPSRDNPVWTMWVLQETGGTVGLGLRTAGALIAVITALFYLFKRDLSEAEAFMAVRLIIIFEAAYWLSFLFSIVPSGFGFIENVGFSIWDTNLGLLLENNLPVIVQATILPAVLIILFLKLSPKKAATSGLKWGLISGVVYILVLWLNNTGNWLYALMQKNMEYLTQYPANMFSFLLTVAGLLLLAIYTAYATVKNRANLANISLRKIGFIITAFGLYFDIIYVMYLALGPVGGWGSWYAWFTGHNLDLWLMALPLAGVPLLFSQKIALPYSRALVYSTQIAGIIYFAIFMAAFYLPLPSNDTLVGDPNFRTPMMISGLIFLALTILSLATAYLTTRKHN